MRGYYHHVFDIEVVEVHQIGYRSTDELLEKVRVQSGSKTSGSVG